MDNYFERRFWIAALVASIVLIWLDFFAGSILAGKKPLLFGVYDLSFLGYTGFVYPFLLLSFWIVPFILYPQKWRYWVLGFLTIWTLNDFLWFIVRPDEWIKFWMFRGVILYKYYFTSSFFVNISDYFMATSITFRFCLIGILYWYWFKRESRFTKTAEPGS